MPEIGEVARIVHFLTKHAVNRTIKNVLAQDDPIVYGKVGTSASAFQSALTGRKIIGAKQQGKYFWLELDKPPHPLMHFGMTGWIRFSNDKSAGYYKPKKEEEDVWPPKFWKFVLELDGEGDVKVAFVDARRLARVRLVDAKAEEMRKTSPLKENGPDPVVDKEILTVDWLTQKMRSKRVPIKALLLDQANISGVGNWVADEVLFQARIHPEQYSNTFSDEQIKKLHDKLIEVCTTACETLAESEKFPQDWLMRHRWNKGKKESSVLPTGEKIIHLTVGGRTSAVVPSLQKKTGAVAGDVSAKDANGEGDNVGTKPGAKKSRMKKAVDEDEGTQKDSKQAAGKKGQINGAAKRSRTAVKKEEEEDGDEEQEEEDAPKPKQAKTITKKASMPKKAVRAEEPPSTGKRRSGRVSRG